MTDQILEKFWDNVQVQPNGCWLWTAGKITKGYGEFWDGQRYVLSHRFSFQVNNGPIPLGLQLDHLCRNPSCVNPEHLEPVTIKVNIMRGNTIPRKNSEKTHCKNGHLFDEENTYIRKPNGSRQCRKCISDRKLKDKLWRERLH